MRRRPPPERRAERRLPRADAAVHEDELTAARLEVDAAQRRRVAGGHRPLRRRAARLAASLCAQRVGGGDGRAARLPRLVPRHQRPRIPGADHRMNDSLRIGLIGTGFLARTRLLAPQTASRRASWRPSRPLDELPDAPDGLRRAITCRQAHLATSPPADKSALAPSEPSTPALFCRSRRIAVTA